MSDGCDAVRERAASSGGTCFITLAGTAGADGTGSSGSCKDSATGAMVAHAARELGATDA